MLLTHGYDALLSRLWDIECGACLRVLEGHEELVRCIRFDGKRVVSGAYDGYVFYAVAHFDHVTRRRIINGEMFRKIKVWDLLAALDPRAPPGTICLRTLVVCYLR